MGAVLQTLKKEAWAYKVFLGMVWGMLTDKKFYSKVRLWPFFKAFFRIVHEALTDSGRSCEGVAEDCLGKGNFTALRGKVAIITGASNGLGLENARVLLKYGCHVIWAVRNLDKAKKAFEDIEAKEGKVSGKATFLKVDLSDLTTVKDFVNAFLDLDVPLHYLILNAGIMSPLQWEPSKQGYESMFATNNLGHHLLTQLLMPKIEATSQQAPEVRIVILTSCTSQMCSGIDVRELPVSKEHYHELGDYCVTKAVDVFQARFLQEKFKGRNIYAVSAHPGVIETGLLSHNPGFGALFYDSVSYAPFRKNVPSGAATTMYCVLGTDVPAQVKNGYFYFYNRAPQKTINITAPGAADHLIWELEDLQLHLVRPYM